MSKIFSWKFPLEFHFNQGQPNQLSNNRPAVPRSSSSETTKLMRLFLIIAIKEMPEKWIGTEYSRETCISPLLVSDPKYVLDYQFTATSWTSSGKPWYGRASKKIPSSWCPENNDKRSYLQVGIMRKHQTFLKF